MKSVLILFLLAAAALTLPGASAAPTEPHAIFRRSCSECDEGAICEFSYLGAPEDRVACVTYPASDRVALYRRYANSAYTCLWPSSSLFVCGAEYQACDTASGQGYPEGTPSGTGVCLQGSISSIGDSGRCCVGITHGLVSAFSCATGVKPCAIGNQLAYLTADAQVLKCSTSTGEVDAGGDATCTTANPVKGNWAGCCGALNTPF